MEQMRIVKEQREESKNQLIATFGENFDRTKIKPRYMVWENVCHCGTTRITTSTGYKYIKDVEVGEMVRTHDGTYHKVLQTYKTEMQPTIKFKYQGGEITCTPNHPFLTEDLTYKPIGEFSIGDRVGFKVDEPGTKSIGMATAYAFGRWLADGSVAIRNDRKTKHRIFISTGYKKYEDLKSELSRLPYRINEHKMDWAINFTFSSDEFGELTDSAGYGARNKQVPEWVFNLVAEERNEVLRGYLAGDGHFREDRGTWCFATSSEKLALGLCRLIRAIYHIGVSLSYIEGKGTTIIAGREVNAHNYWSGEFTLPTKYEHNLKGIANGSKYKNGYVWVRIREISEGETQDVYNLSVEDNNTYEANGVVCHNCGALSSGTPAGSDFQAVLEEICKIVRHDCPVVPIPKDGWPSAGNLDGVGDDGTPFSICWRVHDAQHWGVPQRRRRIALVADFGGSSAPEILLEPYSLQGHSKQSSKERQGVARDTSNSVGETSSGSSTEQSRGSGERGIKESSKVYGICSFDSNAMKSDNPESGIYEADSARTLDLNGGNPACNQGGMAVVQGADVYNGDVTGDVAPSVTTKTGEPGSSGPKVIESTDKCLNSWDVQSKHIQPEDGIAESLYSGECRYGGGESYVLQNQKEPVLLESSQNHATVQTDGVSTTLPASMGEGGGYVPMVCIEGNGSRDSHKGDGYSESETMYTLNTVEQHAVAYGVTAKGNGDAFINPDTHTSLATGGGEPGQGYPCVLTTENVPETYQKTTGALMASGYSKLGTQEAANDMYDVQQSTVQSMELFHCTTEENLAAPLKARDYKDPQVVAFEPGAASRVGGHVYDDGTVGTLRAEMGDNQQAIVQSAGFCTEHSANARGIGYQEETAPTLREGVVPATIYESKAVESHAQDARYNVGDVNQTLGANMEHDAANGGLVYDVDYNAEKSDICYGFQGQTGGSVPMPIGENVTPTLIANQTLNVVQPTAFKKSSHAKSAEDGQGWEHTEVNDTLNAFDNGETRTPTLVLNDQGGQQMQVSQDQTATLRAEEHGHQPLVFDASRRHDYKPFGDVAETVQAQYGTGGNNTPMVMDMLNLNPQETEKSMTLNAYNGTGGNNMPMVFENHSQDTRYNAMGETCQTVSATWGMGGNNQPLEVKLSGGNDATTRNPILQILWETYGEEKIIQWGADVLDTLQQTDLLQQGMHESSVQNETKDWNELDNNTPPSSAVVAEWLLRDMRKHQECGCASQGWQPTEQQSRELAEIMQELPQPRTSACKTLFNMWETGKGLWVLQQTLHQIQEIRQSSNGERQSVQSSAVVRRLTPTECERLQGFPNGWCHIGDWVDSNGKKHKDSDSPKYKALGNSIALPFWDWMAERMVNQLNKSGVENPTMASLFDGIAGFPYVYIRHGCMPLWTSEIEEYPIAVCKKHFGDEDTGEVGDIEEYLKLPPNWVTNSSTQTKVTNTPISFDRAAFNQGANAKYDFAIEDNDKAQTIVARGPGGVCQPK